MNPEQQKRLTEKKKAIYEERIREADSQARLGEDALKAHRYGEAVKYFKGASVLYRFAKQPEKYKKFRDRTTKTEKAMNIIEAQKYIKMADGELPSKSAQHLLEAAGLYKKAGQEKLAAKLVSKAEEIKSGEAGLPNFLISEAERIFQDKTRDLNERHALAKEKLSAASQVYQNSGNKPESDKILVLMDALISRRSAEIELKIGNYRDAKQDLQAALRNYKKAGYREGIQITEAEIEKVEEGFFREKQRIAEKIRKNLEKAGSAK